ncbi:MAG: vanadium-dependent haloperoxidase [Bacteroidia bacterium]|nr:vanadium-dependent haloperoxidase [Bacteroidia bacterium]
MAELPDLQLELELTCIFLGLNSQTHFSLKPLLKNQLFYLLLILTCFGLGCTPSDPTDPTIIDNTKETNFVSDWMEKLGSTSSRAGLNSPKASRVFAYCGIACYEGIHFSNTQLHSLENKINGLTNLPKPSDSKSYHWGLVSSFAQKQVSFYLFNTASIELRQELVDLAQNHRSQLMNQGVSAEIIGNSIYFGEELGNAIIQWIMNDNFKTADTSSYTIPTGLGLWEPTASGNPVLPHWDKFRYLVSDPEMVCSPGIPNYFSTETNSIYYQDAYEVYELSSAITDDQKQIADYWADGKNGVSAAHHALELLRNIIRQKNLNQETSALAFVKLSIGLSDVYQNCWKTKYQHNSMRPETYIKQQLNNNWQPYLSSPATPEFSSAMAVQSGMIYQVFQDLFGDLNVVDSSLVSKGISPRSYSSVNQLVDEAAYSSLYGGTQFRHSIEQGMYQGRCIGQKINELDL